MFRALAFLSLLVTLTAHGSDSPSTWVAGNTAVILTEIQRADLAVDDAAGQRALAERVIIPLVDVDGIAMRAVGRPWRDISQPDQRRFIDGMQIRLLDLYGAAFSQFKAAELEVLRERLSTRGDRAIVTTRLRRPGEDWLATEFRLIESDTGWRVLDVAVEGVSLLSSYKAQIDDKIAKIGLQATVEEVAAGR